MAGKCRPDGAGREVNIIINDIVSYTPHLPAYDKNILINGELTTIRFHNAVLLDNYFGPADYVIFTTQKRCNIWAITAYYCDGGGVIDKPVKLYRKREADYIAVGMYPTVDRSIGRAFGKWYKLFSNLSAGTYKIEATSMYAGFQEFYGEGSASQLYLRKNQVYGIR